MRAWHTVALVLLACPAWAGVLFADGGACAPPCQVSGGSVSLTCTQSPCAASCIVASCDVTFPDAGQFHCSNSTCTFTGGHGSNVTCDVSTCDIRVGDDSTVICAGQCIVTAGERLTAFREYVAGSMLTVDAGNDATVETNVNGEVEGSFGANADISGPGLCDVSVGPGSTVDCASSRVVCLGTCVVTASSCAEVTCVSGVRTSGSTTCSCGAFDAGTADGGVPIADGGANSDAGAAPADAGLPALMDAGDLRAAAAGLIPVPDGPSSRTPVVLTVGCGCQGVDAASVLAAALWFARLRRLRKQRLPSTLSR